jgi:hypothetical protein
MVYRLDNQGVAGGPIMTVAGQQPNPDRQGIASGHQPVAVMLDFVHPARPGWRLLARGWQARLDEAGPVGARQHVNRNHPLAFIILTAFLRGLLGSRR